MLSDAERRDIERQLALYPDPRAASVEALKVVQERRGWIPDDALADVARLLDMSEAELEAVATFYSLLFRRPVGDHVVLVCDSVSCWLLGSDALIEAFRSRHGVGLGETTADGRFTLLPIPCLGACDGAPAMMVDGDLYRNVEPERLDEILDAYPARDGGRS